MSILMEYSMIIKQNIVGVVGDHYVYVNIVW